MMVLYGLREVIDFLSKYGKDVDEHGLLTRRAVVLAKIPGVDGEVSEVRLHVMGTPVKWYASLVVECEGAGERVKNLKEWVLKVSAFPMRQGRVYKVFLNDVELQELSLCVVFMPEEWSGIDLERWEGVKVVRYA